MNFDNYKIVKNTPIPFYYQLKQIILEELSNSKPHDVLPPEEALCETFGISRTTVRQAIIELVNEGYLYRVKSKGTFVAQPKIATNLYDMYGGFNVQVEKLNMIPYMKVVRIEVIKANKRIAKQLKIPENEKVIFILRYRYADNILLGHIESYLKYPLCTFVNEEKLNSSSMYIVLSQNALTRISKVYRTIEPCYANERELRLMNMQKGGLINLCTILGFSSQSGEPIIYEIVKYRGDKIKYTIEVDLK